MFDGGMQRPRVNKNQTTLQICVSQPVRPIWQKCVFSRFVVCVCVCVTKALTRTHQRTMSGKSEEFYTKPRKIAQLLNEHNAVSFYSDT